MNKDTTYAEDRPAQKERVIPVIFWIMLSALVSVSVILYSVAWFLVSHA